MKTTKLVIIAVSIVSVLFLVWANAGIDSHILKSGEAESVSNTHSPNAAKVIVDNNEITVKGSSVSTSVFSISTVITLFAVLLGMVAFRRNNY